jgi:hypothetical protein
MTAVTSLASTLRHERKIVAAFRQLGAISGERAQRLKKLGLSDGPILRGLVTAEIVRRAGAERYFLDEQVWATRRRLPARTVLMLVLAIGLAAVFAAISVAGH